MQYCSQKALLLVTMQLNLTLLQLFMLKYSQFQKLIYETMPQYVILRCLFLKTLFQNLVTKNFSFRYGLIFKPRLSLKNLIDKQNICMSFLSCEQFYCVLKSYFCCCKSFHRLYMHKDFLGYFLYQQLLHYIQYTFIENFMLHMSHLNRFLPSRVS